MLAGIWLTVPFCCSRLLVYCEKLNVEIINIRLVDSRDDGGIRQSERQYIPELLRCGVRVVGVVLGEDLGNYGDQQNDFKKNIESPLLKYKGGMVARLKALVCNYLGAGKTAKKIHSYIADDIKSTQPTRRVVNVRRVNLIPIALQLARTVDGTVVFHSGVSFRRGPLGVNHIVYWWLKRNPRLKIIANSRFSAASYSLAADDFVYPGVSTGRVVDTVVDSNIRSQLGVAEHAPLFLYLARVNWDKAPDLLLKGFLDSEHALALNASLIIAGPIQDEGLELKLRSMINEYDAGGRVHLVGSQRDVSSWYKAADVFVNSRRGVEPFGISIVEGMAAGLPILSSALGGPSETVIDGENGWLVHELSAKGYRDAVDRAIKDKGSWGAFGKRSMKLSEMYTVERQVQRYLKHCCQ